MTNKPHHQPHGRGGVLIQHQPKCKATSKRTGQPCQGVAMANGCCWAHGGKSTGPKKPHIKHGYATKAAKAQQAALRAWWKHARTQLQELGG